MRHRAYLFLFCALLLSGCGESLSERPAVGYQPGFAAPGPMAPYAGGPNSGRLVVALLLPVTGPRADIGQILLQVAQLALADNTGPALDVLDTGGTASGATVAAETAIAHHDSLIIGPLTSVETTAVAPIARGAGVPVLAFTNDPAQSQPGVWPLGITPDQQIRRLVVAAQAQGKTQFAALLPDSDFGQVMATGLTKALGAANLPPPEIRTHASGMAAITATIRDLSDYANRRGPIDARIKAARALGTPEGRREANELARTAVIPPPSFNVLVLADTGEALQEIAAVLPYYDIDRSAVQIVGPILWADPASGSGAVTGAWYAAPDTAARATLERDYAAKYGAPPPPLADLAFDAASIAKLAVGTNGADPSILTQPGGFVGSDGWFALLPDGRVKRGLAVYRIERGGPELIDPAPQSAESAGL